MKLTSILVIIPTLNEAEHIESVIGVLSKDLPPDCSVNFVVADGGSTDGTQSIVERVARVRSDVRLINNPHRLQSAGINQAVELFGDYADLLVRCDAHSVYPTGYIARLVETISETGADSVVVSMDTIGKGCFQNAVAWVSDTKMGSGGSAHRAGRQSGFVDHGHHAAMRVASFRAAGGYDPTFSHNEDAELDCRIGELGGRVWLDAELRIGYYPRGNPKALARQYFNYGCGRSRTVRRHPKSMRLRQAAVPLHCGLMLISLVAGFVIHPIFWGYIALYVIALSLGAVGIALKQRSLCGLLAAPAAAVMHLAWAVGFAYGFASMRDKAWRPPDGAVSLAPLEEKR